VRATLKILQCSSILLLLLIPSGGSHFPLTTGEVLAARKEIINPHWTGNDCEICHEERPKPRQKDLKFKFGGDFIAMCKSCHQGEDARSDIHPVGVYPREGDKVSIPDWLPLQGGKTTCVTCHDMKLHIENNPPIRFKNPDFLRGGPYKNKIDLCFNCHKVKAYKKINPHQQIDAEDRIVTTQCLYCHQSLPNSDTITNIEEVTFKTEIGTFCTACHPEEESNHPAYANHMLPPSREMIKHIKESEKKLDVILPLFKDNVFCGTCHNPHSPGVIKGSAASKGARETHRLRLNSDYELCVACHAEKEFLLTKKVTIAIQEEPIGGPASTGETHTAHNAYRDKKCRACHTITSEQPERPSVYKLCFQGECHNTETLLGGDFVHTMAVQGNCLFCHNQHKSQYGYHIVNDQRKLCKACHPLLLGEKEDSNNRKSKDYHDNYLSMFKKVIHDQEPTCIFCHGKDHRPMVKEWGIKPCYKCHNYIKQLVKGERGKQVNIHDTFSREMCTDCHNPHSSPHPDLLKEKKKVYLKDS
jgi:predicted CXXCH cytochrome family protein